MLRKTAFIMGLIGSGLMLLPNLWFIGSCIYALQLPDTPLSWESKGYTEGFLIISIITTLILAVGLIGSLLVFWKRIASGVLMIIAGTVTVLFPGSSLALESIFTGQFPVQLHFILPLIVLAAGILALAAKTKTALPSHEPSAGKPDDTL